MYENSITTKDTQINAFKTLIFNDWGSNELLDESGYIQSRGARFSTHTMSKRENGILYTVNFEQKSISSFVLAKSTPIIDINTSKNENILGYTCKVIETPKAKLCIYKGLILKNIVMTDDVQMISRAVEIDFNATFKPEAFNLPSFTSKKDIESKNSDNEYLIQGVDISDIIEGTQVIQSLIE